MFDKLKINAIPGEAFREFSSDIAKYNLKNMKQISFIGMSVSILLVIASLPPLRFLSMIKGYFAIAVLFTLMFILTCTVLKRHAKAVLPAYYVFITAILALAVIMGTVWGKNTNATTFLMLILMFPILIIDRQYRINILSGIMCVIFCIVDSHVKEGELFELDLVNCIVFYLLSVIISSETIKAKMSDIIIKHELKQQRDIDMLTKLSNRGAFERIVTQYIHESNQNAVLMIMDIDNFKSVNDTMGHAYGDTVLQIVGEYLRATFCKSDTVSRLGGDEFVAFLPSVTDLGLIAEKANRLIDQIADIKIESEAPCRIGASVGIAQYPFNGCSFEELYKRADEALYCAKQSGKGKCFVYNAGGGGTLIPSSELSDCN